MRNCYRHEAVFVCVFLQKLTLSYHGMKKNWQYTIFLSREIFLEIYILLLTVQYELLPPFTFSKDQFTPE